MAETNLLPYAIAWAVLAMAVIVLAVWKKSVSNQEDDTLKLSDGEVEKISEQREVASRLNRIEAWGKALTVVAVVSGLALGAMWGLQLWNATASAGLR